LITRIPFTIAQSRCGGRVAHVPRHLGAEIKRGQKPPNCIKICQGKTGESVVRSDGWGGRIRTSEWRNQPFFTKNVLDPMVGHKPYYGNRHGKLRGPIGR
jgi:hypothetical protein